MVQSSDKQKIPAREATHTPDFVVNDELLIIHPENIQTMHLLNTSYLKCEMFSVCVVVKVSYSHKQQPPSS